MLKNSVGDLPLGNFWWANIGAKPESHGTGCRQHLELVREIFPRQIKPPNRASVYGGDFQTGWENAPAKVLSLEHTLLFNQTNI